MNELITYVDPDLFAAESLDVYARLALLNAYLREISEKTGFGIGEISVDGVEDGDESDIIKSIARQFNGISRRAFDEAQDTPELE